MKKFFGTGVLFFIFLVVTSSNLVSDINFGSRDSSIKVSGGTFNVTSSSLDIGGTLYQAAGAFVTGSPFGFTNGILNHAGSETLLTANFDPTGGDTINLTGSDSLRVEPGTIIKQINVDGVDNTIEGHLNLENPIVLIDADTVLTLGIQNVLNQDINLNGGRLILRDNLRLGDDVRINGPGTVELNGFRLDLGGFYSTLWNTDITFKGATDFVLNAETVLTGNWTFQERCVLNGNGTILDLSDGGTLTVSGADGQLFLDDLHVKGLSDLIGGGMIAFDADGARLFTSNTFIELDGDYTTSLGEIVINGTTTFLIKNFNWVFDGLGFLRVNDRLWIDVYHYNGAIGEPTVQTVPPSGQVMAPNPLFVHHILDLDNLTANILAGFMAFDPDNGSIKEICDRSVGLSSAALALVEAPVTENIFLDVHVDIHSGQTINITQDVTIDGGGNVVTFSCGLDDTPQFVVAPGVTVTLQDITFTRICCNTFDLGEGATVLIGANVLFELICDVEFDLGRFVVLPPIRQDGTVWSIRGLGGKRRWTLNPPIQIDNGTKVYLIDLGNNVLHLQNMEFDGLAHTLVGPQGSIVLGGNTSVLLESFEDVVNGLENKDVTVIPANFDIENTNNDLILLEDALTIAGSISFFGLASTNFLNVRFSLPEPIIDFVPVSGPRTGVAAGYPLVVFSGDPGVFLTSLSGDEGLDNTGVLTSRVGMTFPDSRVAVRNVTENSFVVETNSFLRFRDLLVYGEPIKQSSTLFELSEGKIGEEGLATQFVRGIKSRKPVTTYGKIVARKLQALQERREKILKKLGKPKRKARKKRKKKKHNIFRSLDGGELVSEEFLAKTRKLEFPADGRGAYTPYPTTNAHRKNPMNGNFEIDGGTVTNFFGFELDPLTGETPGPNEDLTPTPFNILLKNGATLVQAFDKDFKQASNQVINIAKGDVNLTKIQVTRDFEVNDNFRIEEGAQVIVEFVPGAVDYPIFRFGSSQVDVAAPTRAITQGTQFKLEPDAVLKFTGRGIVELDQHAAIYMLGKKVPERDPDGKPLKDKDGRPKYIITKRPTLDIGPDVKFRVRGNNNTRGISFDFNDMVLEFSSIAFKDGALPLMSDVGFITGVGQIICAGSLEPHNGTLHLWPRAIEYVVDPATGLAVEAKEDDPDGKYVAGETEVTHLGDDIILRFVSGGNWNMDNGSKTTTGLGTGRIYFDDANCKLQIRNGELAINDQSLVPILRVPGDTLKQGDLKAAIFSGDPKIIVEKDGKISWGINDVISDTISLEDFIFFKGSSLSVVPEPGATFNLVSRPADQESDEKYRGIENAQIQPKTNDIFTNEQATSTDIAHYFINVNPNMKKGSIEFVTTGGLRKVRTVKGIVVDILTDDRILGDEVTDGGSVLIRGQRLDADENRVDFTIDQDGN